MNIIETTISDAPDFERPAFTLQVDEKEVLYVKTPEPEDATIVRDLSFVYRISSLMKAAYEAGVKGEGFTVTSVKKDSYED